MNINDFGPFILSPGSHKNPQEGMCAMEMVSFLAGEKWTDMPECSSPVVSMFCQVINDGPNQETRDRLQTYVPRLIGTASPEHDKERAEYLAWAAIRVFAPLALRKIDFDECADRLENFSGAFWEASKIAHDAYSRVRDECNSLEAHSVAHSVNNSSIAARSCAASTSVNIAAFYAADAACEILDTNPECVFQVLDGLLEIGPSGSSHIDEHINRLAQIKKETKQIA